jgi:hypothetical protein
MHDASVHGGAFGSVLRICTAPDPSIDIVVDPVVVALLPRFQASPASCPAPTAGPAVAQPDAVWGVNRHAAVHCHVLPLAAE